MSLDQNPVNLDIKSPHKIELSDYDLLQTLGAGKTRFNKISGSAVKFFCKF